MNSLISLNIRLLIFLLIPVFLHSCKPARQQKDQNDVIHLAIDPAHLPPIAKLSEISKSVRIIPLETNPLCFIGAIHEVYLGGNSILLSTSGADNKLLHFTSDGKFLNKIGSQGKGPGEYTDVNDISVFEHPSRVFIYPSGMRKILEYNFNGDLNREIPLGKGLINPIVLDENRIGFISFIDYEVWIINTLTSDTAKYIKLTPETASVIRVLDGDPSTGFFYTAIGRDTIWKFDADSLKPEIICNFGSGHYSSQEYTKSVVAGQDFLPGKLSIGLGKILYGSGYYHIFLMRENDRKEYLYAHVLIEEKTNKSWHLDEGSASDDILFCTSTDFKTVASTGEWISVVGAGELIEVLPKIKANKNFSYPPELIAHIEKMTIEDNPVVVLYTLK